jgi:hypothetical protein
LRDSGLPADVLLGKLKKDISFALRRGTIAQVTTHHHLALDGFAWLRLASRLRLASARSSAEDEELLPALNRRATGRRVGTVKQSLGTMLISFLSLCLLTCLLALATTWTSPAQA